MISAYAVCFEKISRWRFRFRAARALGPPRLAAGAGDRNFETLKDFYDLGLFGAILERFFVGCAHMLAKTSQTTP